MLLSWLRSRRRRQRRAQGIPDHLLPEVRRYLWQYDRLSTDQQQKLLADAAVLMAEKNWEGCGGQSMDDHVRLAVSLQLALLTLGLGHEYFDSVLSILVYPDQYRVPERLHQGGGVVLERESVRLGEAWHRGPVILSYADVLEAGDGPNGGRSIVAHEFAHQLDMHNGGDTDGVPPLASREQADHWLSVTGASLRQLRRDCRTRSDPMVDCYGAGDPSEFFAVVSETFFQDPERIAWRDRPLYDVLVEYYRVEPLKWVR